MDFKQGLFSSVCGLELRDYLIHWGILKNKVSVVFLLFDRHKNKGAAESQPGPTHTRTVKKNRVISSVAQPVHEGNVKTLPQQQQSCEVHSSLYPTSWVRPTLSGDKKKKKKLEQFWG